jgi:ribosome assembly protein YihI (activator of Der GTPase)
MTRVSNSGKVPGSDSGKESGTASDKGPGKRPCKNLGKEAGQDKTCKAGRFFASGSTQVERGDLKESEPRTPNQEEDQRIQSKFKVEVKEEIGSR